LEFVLTPLSTAQNQERSLSPHMIAELIKAWQTSGDSERIAAQAQQGHAAAQAVLDAYDYFLQHPSEEAAHRLREAYRRWQQRQSAPTEAPRPFDPLDRLRRLARS
jgi:hypothetical protein